MARGKYEPWLTTEGLLRLQGWARDGLTDVQIAHNIGISVKTLYEWKRKYIQFSEALKKGKEVVDIEVENALLKRALGYRAVEIVRERVDGDLVVTKEISKEVPPDTTAQIFWLKNRRPDKYRDRIAVDPPAGSNNIFDVIRESTGGAIDTDGIPELEQAAEPGDDVVE